jgi:hypothetical protein
MTRFSFHRARHIDRSPNTVLVVRISSVALAACGTKLDEGGGKRRSGITQVVAH